MIEFDPYSLTSAHNPMLERSFNTVMETGGVHRIGANEGTLVHLLIAPLPVLKNTQRKPNKFPVFVVDRRTTVTGTSNA